MKGKHTETGGVSCGICETSLQQATLGFGICDVAHGIVGVSVVLSMILKQEVDEIYKLQRARQLRETGYAKFLQQVPAWSLYLILGGFILQIAIGMLACLGATFRNSTLCSLWMITSFLSSPLTPITYCLLILGRVYEWVTVGEFIWKMDEEELELKKGLKNRKEIINNKFFFHGDLNLNIGESREEKSGEHDGRAGNENFGNKNVKQS